MISAFITHTPSIEKNTTFAECYAQAKEVFDEVIVINGDDTWPYEFDWPVIGQHFQRGYEACTGDWVTHLDSDFFIHQNDYQTLRDSLKQHSQRPAVSFWKYQFILPHMYNLKSRLVVCVNKKVFGDRIRFDSGGDLCQPSLDGQYISPLSVPEARVAIYNYEKPKKTREDIQEDVERMDRAYKRHFGKYLYSNGRTAYEGWYQMVKGRYQKHQAFTDTHPKHMIETLNNLTPKQFGFSGFGL